MPWATIRYNKKVSKKVILTGIRANNDLHIGNYFGAILPMVDMAKTHSKDFQINMFVPDLHSFTTPIDYNSLKQQIFNNLKRYLAAGLPVKNSTVCLYRQSYVPAHSELTVILNNFTGVGEMSRMTQYKEKSHNIKSDRITVGLFNYPVLMAADILLYDALYVPVGDDQTQHLEFTRDIAQRMNKQFGNLFTVPLSVDKQHKFFNKDQGLRIRDLVDPSKKMSKSNESDKGVIFLSDNPNQASKKIIQATTDNLGRINFDCQKQPGISNLLQLLALLDKKDLKTVIAEYGGQQNYGEFKNLIAEKVHDFLVNFQKRFTSVNDSDLIAKLKQSEDKANDQAQKKLYKVQQKIGLR